MQEDQFAGNQSFREEFNNSGDVQLITKASFTWLMQLLLLPIACNSEIYVWYEKA